MRFGLLGRIVASTVVLAILVGSIFALMLVTIGDLRDSSRDVQRSDEILATANAVQRQISELEVGLRGYIVTREERFLEPFEAARETAPMQARALVRRLRDDPAQQDRLAMITRDLDRYLTEQALPVIRQVERGELRDATAAISESKRRLDAMSAQFERFLVVEQAKADSRRASAESNARTSILVGVVGLLSSILLVAAFAFYLARSTISPIRRVVAGARHMAAGDLSARVEETGRGRGRGARAHVQRDGRLVAGQPRRAGEPERRARAPAGRARARGRGAGQREGRHRDPA